MRCVLALLIDVKGRECGWVTCGPAQAVLRVNLDDGVHEFVRVDPPVSYGPRAAIFKFIDREARFLVECDDSRRN